MNRQRTRINLDGLKPFCKVCKDAGKPRSIYTSHFPRENKSTNSKVVCPTLLSIKCNYCHNYGHTIKYCPTLSKNKNLKSKKDVQLHIDIQKEINEENKHYDNMEQNPNHPLHQDNIFFVNNTPITASGIIAGPYEGYNEFQWNWGYWGYYLTQNNNNNNNNHKHINNQSSRKRQRNNDEQPNNNYTHCDIDLLNT